MYTVEDPGVCNQSIYLEQGANSAAILKLTSKPSYHTSPLFCIINFKVPIHHWSGLTGVLEHVDLRRYEDNDHHLGQPVCLDYITVKTEKEQSVPNEKQCGTWSVRPGQRLARLGYNKAIVGSCPQFEIGNKKCHVTELQLIVAIGQENEFAFLWKNISWPPHKGFTFVVTAYSYPIKHGESGCRDGLRSCGQADTLGTRLGDHHCIHDSLWCDGHVNCGLRESMDEISCNVRDWDYFMTVVFGPWLGATIFLILMFCLILWYRSSKERTPLETQRSINQEINSYAESYELSSNLSSAHHMAIQVRVVCNSNHPHHGSRNGTLQPWKNDLPPTYESLFPQGPPNIHSPITSITATMSQEPAGSTVNAVGINVSSTMPLPTAVASTSGIRSNEGSTSATENSRALTDITSIIDLNIRSNHLQTDPGTVTSQVSENSNINSLASCSATSNVQTSTIGLNVSSDDIHHSILKTNESNTTFNSNQADTSTSQANVTFITVTPNKNSSKEQCVSTQTDDKTLRSEIVLNSTTTCHESPINDMNSDEEPTSTTQNHKNQEHENQ